MRLTMLNFGYLMLPAFFVASTGAVLAIVLAFDPEKTVLMKSVVVGGVVVIFVSGIWLFKELCQPSRRRTPEWLLRERRGQ